MTRESTTDRILAVIDAGLQSSSEGGYGTDRDPSLRVRCQRDDKGDTGEHCDGCRAYLLGDSDVDPAEAMGTGTARITIACNLSNVTGIFDEVADMAETWSLDATAATIAEAWASTPPTR